jgi:hypothetical protein
LWSRRTPPILVGLSLPIKKASTFHFSIYGLGGFYKMRCLEHLIFDHQTNSSREINKPSAQ